MNQATILIIDDSVEDLRILVTMLRSAGYRLIISSNGRDGCNRAIAFNPDLVLLDVRMPQMNGFSVCRILKATPSTSDIPVIFLTAANTVEERLEGLRLGAVDYICKPALPDEVLLRIGIHLLYRRRIAGRDEDGMGGADMPKHPDEGLAAAVIQIMERNLSLTPTMEELARKVGTTRKRLADVFRQRYGSTVMGWLRDRRMIQAQQWLAETQLSVQVIAVELGYNSAANFATAFKERFGIQPREYRLRCYERTRPKELPPLAAEEPFTHQVLHSAREDLEWDHKMISYEYDDPPRHPERATPSA